MMMIQRRNTPLRVISSLSVRIVTGTGTSTGRRHAFSFRHVVLYLLCVKLSLFLNSNPKSHEQRAEIKSRLKMVSLSLLFKLFLNQIIIASSPSSSVFQFSFSLFSVSPRTRLSPRVFTCSRFLFGGERVKEEEERGCGALFVVEIFSLSLVSSTFFSREK